MTAIINRVGNEPKECPKCRAQSPLTPENSPLMRLIAEIGVSGIDKGYRGESK